MRRPVAAVLVAAFLALFAPSAHAGDQNIWCQNSSGQWVPASASVPCPVNAPFYPTLSNPTSSITLPSTTTAYTSNQLICTNATAATCNTALASIFLTIPNGAGGIARLRLSTNDATSTAWGAQTIQVDLWSVAPTFTNGDRGAWALATGSANHLGSFSCTMSAEQGDGAYAECAPNVGNVALPKLPSGTSVFWTLDATSGSGVTGAGKTFTLTAEFLN